MILLKRVDIDLEAARCMVQNRMYSEKEQHALLSLYTDFADGKFSDCRNRMREWPSAWWEYVDHDVYKVLLNVAHGETYITQAQLRDHDKSWV
jgi:hypothetical protein